LKYQLDGVGFTPFLKRYILAGNPFGVSPALGSA